MRAAVLRNGTMVVDEVDDVVPGPGQVLVETIACGICGSDLHTVHHAHDLVAAAVAAGVDSFSSRLDPDRDVVMGHEVSCRVLDVGAGVENIALGAEYAAMPFLETPTGPVVPGYDNDHPGGYSERMLLSPHALVPIPNGLDPVVAALTEPMAVGLHAVNESTLSAERPAVVIGAGPVGLAIVAALRARGHGPIIVSDFSPTRRAAAEALGADFIVDPSVDEPFAALAGVASSLADHPPVIFEAVGVPGVIDQLMADAPMRSEIVVAGVCIPPDNFRPTMGIYKRLTLRFVLGWSPAEFVESLDRLADGRIDGASLITGEVDLDGVPEAFKALDDPEAHLKVMVRPGR